MRIGIAFDLAPVAGAGVGDGPDDRFEEFDKPETIEALAGVLRGEGHEVALLGDGPDLLRAVLDDPPDFVWNLAEGQGVGRSREARVPAVLEMLGIPYSGSDPLTLAATLDKDVARRLVAGLVPVPKGLVLAPETSRTAAEARVVALGVSPLILKPACEGSSKGIRPDGLADSPAEAASVFDRLARDYRQPILVEEFIVGDEVTVGLIGNGPAAEVLGTMRVVPREPTDRFVYGIDVKRDWKRRVDYEAPARIGEAASKRLIDAALTVYQSLGCRDLARIDFRVREDVPFFLEANPLPGLAPVTSDLVILAEGHGLDHAALIRRVLAVALDRVGLAR